MKTTVFITTKREFIHCFPEASTIPELCSGDEYDVSFLSFAHRHMFGFRVETEVFHDDRDIEFIQLKRTVDQYLETLPKDLGRTSCEQLAKQIIAELEEKYHRKGWMVTVDEDGENGAIVNTML